MPYLLLYVYSAPQRCLSVTVNDTKLKVVDRNIIDSPIATTYLGKEIWSLEMLSDDTLDSTDVIEYRIGNDFALTFSLTSLEMLAASDNASVCTAYGVTIIATAELQENAINVDLYTVDAGSFDDIIEIGGWTSNYSPYISNDDGDFSEGIGIGITQEENSQHISGRYSFDTFGMSSGKVTIGYPAICAITNETVNIPITQDALNGKSLNIKSNLRNSVFCAESVEECSDELFSGVEHSCTFKLNYTNTNDDDGIFVGQFRQFSVNGMNIMDECVFYGETITPQGWPEISPISFAMNSSYNEIKDITLKQPQYWLTNCFEFTFDIGKLKNSVKDIPEREISEELNTERAYDSLAECWHGDNKLKYICDLPEFTGKLYRYETEPIIGCTEHYRVICADPTEQQVRDYIQQVKDSGYNIDPRFTDALDEYGYIEYIAQNEDGVVCTINYSLNEGSSLPFSSSMFIGCDRYDYESD